MSSLRPYLTTRQDGSSCCPNKPERHCVTEYRRQKEIVYTCYSDWLPNARILLPHIPDNIILDYVRRAVIEFAEKTKILTRNVELIIQENVGDYWPCLGAQERISRVKLLSVNGHCYKPVGHTCSWQVGSHRYWFHPPNSLEIHPAPKECVKVLLTVDAVPSEDSTHVDRLIKDRHFDAILNHAVAYASLVPPMDDSDNVVPLNSSIFQVRMKLFNDAVTRSKIDQRKNYSDTVQTWGGRCGNL